jgi:hypothetical protein
MTCCDIINGKIFRLPEFPCGCDAPKGYRVGANLLLRPGFKISDYAALIEGTRTAYLLRSQLDPADPTYAAQLTIYNSTLAQQVENVSAMLGFPVTLENIVKCETCMCKKKSSSGLVYVVLFISILAVCMFFDIRRKNAT